jgi:ribonuclease Y
VTPWIASIAAFLAGIVITIVFYQVVRRAKAKTLEQDLQKQLDGAKKEAENIIKSAQIDAAAETIKRREEFNKEANQTRIEFREIEARLSKREDSIDRQVEQLQSRENAITEQQKDVERRLQNIGNREKELNSLLAQQKNQLLKISAMSIEDAKELLLKNIPAS